MNVERPNATPLSRADLEHLDRLKEVVEKAVADGVVTNDERAQISAIIWADGQATPEELHVVQELIWSKLQSGDLTVDWR